MTDNRTVREVLGDLIDENDHWYGEDVANRLKIDPNMTISEIQEAMESWQNLKEMRAHFNKPKVDIVMPEEWFEERAAVILDMETADLQRRLRIADRAPDPAELRRMADWLVGSNWPGIERGLRDMADRLTREDDQ